MATMKIAAALAFGNTCVLKPSEQTPLALARLVIVGTGSGGNTALVLLIDNSGSMSPQQQALAANFSTFINWAVTLDMFRNQALMDEQLRNIAGRHQPELLTLTEAQVHRAGGTRGQVDGGPAEGLVEGHHRPSEALDPGPVAQGLVEGAAQGQGAVLGRVVVVYLEIARAGERQVDSGMLCERLEQVVEESYTG